VLRLAGVAAFLLSSYLGAVSAASAADVPRSQLPVQLDGFLDEAAWTHALGVAIDIETRPGENTPSNVRTTAYLLEDGENLYVAFDAKDPDPARIRAFLRDRDSAWTDDFVGIVLDTYGDAQRAFEFFVNPYGIQMDLTYDDIRDYEDSSWDGIWDSAGRIHETGFIVEMQIPLNQLRFPKRSGPQSWRVDLLRFYPRDHRYRLSNNALDRNRNCYLCQLSAVEGFENAEPGRALEIAPTLTALRSESTDDPTTAPLSAANTDVEAGLSVRWGVTPDITANLAINPDFSQVEADTAQLDVNNQFALYYPEKRPFFLEGADYFSSPIEAVFTRTVADPSVGAKLTGKRGKNTFGFVVTQDELTNLLFPGAYASDSGSLAQENTAVVGRYSRSFGEASTAGLLLTGRRGDGYHNHVGGVDLRWKISDQHSIQAQHLVSDTEYPEAIVDDFDQPAGSFDGAATEFRYDYTSRSWFAYLLHSARDAGFRADAGFVPRADYNQQIAGLGHVWHGDEGDWYSRLEFIGDFDITHDDNGRMIEREVEAYFAIQGRMQSFLEFGGLSRDTLYAGVLFHERNLRLEGEFQPRGGVEIGGWLRVGSQVDFDNVRLADEIRLEPYVAWNATRQLLLRYTGVYDRLDTQEGARIFDAFVHDLRLTWQFSARSFLRLTVQIQDIARDPTLYVDEVDARTENIGRQLLYSYKLNPQTVFFLGYSDALLDDDSLSHPTHTDRTWFMKVGYAWTR
jgi:hypothetical protein